MKEKEREINFMKENLLFAINGISPIFINVVLGYFLKQKKTINEEFCSMCSKLVYYIALPIMLFKNVATTDIKNIFEINTTLFAIIVTLLIFIVFQVSLGLFVKKKIEKGAFIQGILRGNYAIYGLTIAFNLFGQIGITKCAILLAFLMPFTNILSVIALTLNSTNNIKTNWLKLFMNIIKHPLVIASVIALPFSFFKITLPEIAVTVLENISSLALPLALIGIGGSFSFSGMKKSFKLSIIATVLRTIIIPACITYFISVFGFRGVDAGILFIFFASPTAVSSYIMAKNMHSDSVLASNIILMTTIVSIFTMTIGIYLLKSSGII